MTINKYLLACVSFSSMNVVKTNGIRRQMRTVFVNGTVLNVHQITSMRRLAHLHLQFLKNQVDTPETFNKFLLEALKIDVKCAQHFIGSAYPKRTALLQDLITFYPGIHHQTPVELSSSLDYKYNIATACAYLLKTNKHHKMFGSASITVLEPLKEDLKQEKSLAMAQTGQPSPDFCIVFDKGFLKFMDLKASLRYINRGHIVIFTNNQDYDFHVKKMLIEQHVFYKKLCPLFSHALKLELDNTALTWHQRNCNVQDYLLNNLALFKDINPSLIFKEEHLYDDYFIKKITKYDQYITSRSFTDMTTTEATLASIISTDNKAAGIYKASNGINANIKKALLELTANTIDILSQK